MSLFLTKNASLLHRWRHLKGVDPESGSLWEKKFLPKTSRGDKLYGFFHNSPYSNWNNKSYFAFETPVLRDTVVSEVYKHPVMSRFGELLKLCEASVLHQLSTPGPWTLFAPANTAFDNIEGGWETFFQHAKEQPVGLSKLLRNHAVQGRTLVRHLRKPLRISAISGKHLILDVSGSFENSDRTISIDGNGRLMSYDRRAHNGFINLIDRLLV